MGVDAYTTHYQDIWEYGHANGKGQESILVSLTKYPKFIGKAS